MPFGIDDAIIAASALSTAGNLFGGFLGSSGQAAANSQTMAFNAQQAQLNRDFQERMSNTAYQRAVQDMYKAGLNPILAANLGGASSPSGSAASATLGNAGALLGAGVSSASQVGQRALDMKATYAQAEKDSSQVPLNETQAGLAKAQTVRTDAETTNVNADTGLKIANSGLVSEQTKSVMVDQVIKSHEANIKAREAADVTAYGTSPIAREIASVLRMLDTLGNDPKAEPARRALKSTLDDLMRRSRETGSTVPNPSRPETMPEPPRGGRGNSVLDSPVPRSNILGTLPRGSTSAP